MIKFISADSFVIDKGVRRFNTKNPNCPDCLAKTWGHGWVSRILDDGEPCLIRRFKCPKCRKIMRCLPESHWPFLRSSKETVLSALKVRFVSAHWPTGTPRQRAGHWLKKFARLLKISCLPQSQTDLLEKLKSSSGILIWLTQYAKNTVTLHPT